MKDILIMILIAMVCWLAGLYTIRGIKKVMFKTRGIKASLETASQIGIMFPESLDVWDGDEMQREIRKAYRVPAKVLRSEAAVAELRKQRIQQAQMEQGLAQGLEIAKALPAAGAAIQKGSALDMLSGGAMEGGQPAQ